MDNPLLAPRPDDPIERVHEYARDLAYLIATGEVDDLQGRSPHQMVSTAEAINQFSLKWGGYVLDTYLTAEQKEKAADSKSELSSGTYYKLLVPGPSFSTLVSFGYMMNVANAWHLTEKAFALLEKPAVAPSTFISYRRAESSALALLIEARLRLVGVRDVFIDKNITAGEDWAQRLEDTIRACQVFIVLVGAHTLNAPAAVVEKEIALAVESNCRIISLWHNGHHLKHEKNYPSVLDKRQFIVVEHESARHYEMAINELLNSLGYRTY